MDFLINVVIRIHGILINHIYNSHKWWIAETKRKIYTLHHQYQQAWLHTIKYKYAPNVFYYRIMKDTFQLGKCYQRLLNYLAFKYFHSEHTWWRLFQKRTWRRLFQKRTWWKLFQKRVVRTQFDIYVFIFNYIMKTTSYIL